MRVLCLITYTDCFNKWKSLEAAGFDVTVEQYDDRPYDRQGEIVELAKTLRPDFIVFIGALEPYHTRPVLQPDVLRRLRDVAPSIHMCNDAADDPWWPKLEEYDRKACFDVQVSIDGSVHNPIASFANGLLTLTPTDHRPFVPKPWGDRGVGCGFVGGIGHSQRFDAISGLRASGHLTFFEGPADRSYDEFARTMCDIKVMPNFPYTGTARFLHVKGRVVEAGFAGCLVVELRGAPTANWFTKGVEYLEYGSIDELRAIIADVDAEPDMFSEMAARFHDRVVAEHHPVVFWRKVLDKAGVNAG
jgi:hypothetical protein